MPAKFTLEFTPAAAPITELVTKFGGQPVWLQTPQWPLSRETKKPMRFICQIALDRNVFPDAAGQMAYLFMTDEPGDFVDGTYEADGGENAIVVQPGKVSVPVSEVVDGPTLYRMVASPGQSRLQPEPVEFSVRLTPGDDPAYLTEDERGDLSDEELEVKTPKLDENKIGGTPAFLQGDEFPAGENWRLLIQLDSSGAPFSINFGDAGIGYGFLNAAGDEGKFFWQC